MNYSLEIHKTNKLPDGKTEIPFEFPLKPKPGVQLYETYHGVFVNIQVQLIGGGKIGGVVGVCCVCVCVCVCVC